MKISHQQQIHILLNSLVQFVLRTYHHVLYVTSRLNSVGLSTTPWENNHFVVSSCLILIPCINLFDFPRNKYTSAGIYARILEPELHWIDLLFARKLPFTGSSFKHTKCQDTPKSHNTLYLWPFYSQHDYNAIKNIHQWEMLNYFLWYWNRSCFEIKIQSYQNVIANVIGTSN